MIEQSQHPSTESTGDDDYRTRASLSKVTVTLPLEQHECGCTDGKEESEFRSESVVDEERISKPNLIVESTMVATAHDDHTQPTATAEKPPFAMGDHVYQWRSLALLPGVFQHHGIVLNAWWNDDDCSDNHEERGWMLKIFDFTTDVSGGSTSHPSLQGASNFFNSVVINTTAKAEALGHRRGYLRVFESPARIWQKVQYDANLVQRNLAQSGTCTAAPSDTPGMVRSRAQFLIDHPDIIPDYDVLTSNCECVAVWCKTGIWSTLQAASWLSFTAAGQVKSAATVAGVAASTQITVPATGIWGWMGYTQSVPLLTLHPALVPAIAAYGVITVGLPLASLWRCKVRWKQITDLLNTGFWNAALEQPETFAECITHWSTTTTLESDEDNASR